MEDNEAPAVPCAGCPGADSPFNLTIEDVEDVAEFFRRYNDSLFTPSDEGDLRGLGETGLSA
jgi:hypothetical protein